MSSGLDILLGIDGSFEEPLLMYAHPDIHGDAPDKYRWRAWWQTSSSEMTGITLQAYPVVRATAAGVWIDSDAWRRPNGSQGGASRVWDLSGNYRWVSDRAAQSWAKPTQREALISLSERLNHWVRYIRRDYDRALDACSVLERLLPAHRAYARAARAVLTTPQETAR